MMLEPRFSYLGPFEKRKNPWPSISFACCELFGGCRLNFREQFQTIPSLSHPCSSLFLNPATLPIQSAINPLFRRLFSFEIASNKNREVFRFYTRKLWAFFRAFRLKSFRDSTRRATQGHSGSGCLPFHSRNLLP